MICLGIRTALFFPIHLIDFVLSSFGKVLGSSKTVKSPIVWDFPDIQKLGFIFTARLWNYWVRRQVLQTSRKGFCFVCLPHPNRVKPPCASTSQVSHNRSTFIRDFSLRSKGVCSFGAKNKAWEPIHVAKTKNPIISSVFLCSETKWKHLPRGLAWLRNCKK